jgi:SAM-dependent methyltransferase
MARKKNDLSEALWQIYRRPDIPQSWSLRAGNLPWNEPEFSQRMLHEHLDEGHGAASRQTAEREAQITWLWRKLNLQAGQHLLDVTCGPGLYAVEFAKRGVEVTGVDFSPAAIGYAQELAKKEGVNGRTHFSQQDIRQMAFGQKFDAAILLYGQLAVFPPAEAQSLLIKISELLRPGGKLCIELLHPDHVDKSTSNWWFTDDKGLWGDNPFLHLGERFWLENENTSVERYHIVDMETGKLLHIELCDRVYKMWEVAGMMQSAGLTAVDVYPDWDMLPLYDAEEWVVYVAG